ncbi:NifB/NifX family molybdenum-iron cluster-binding protein [Floridanema evergladense]|uniref:NifB/NifX family molybdenum-iron cluster-binding protein n=1 Tax=Floridaenema evergladense BLCC-F167 TaxID=3153639 RepID=A0ABV4WN77_9CYAN
MKIALASQNKTTITQHAGHCQKFWIYETKESEIIDKKLLELSRETSFHNSSPHAPHPLDEVQVLIAGGMGRGLAQRLERKGIEAVITEETDLDKAVSAYLDGSLVRGKPECHEHEHEEKHQHQQGHECENAS